MKCIDPAVSAQVKLGGAGHTALDTLYLCQQIYASLE